jgi:hypothetical protein
MWNLSLHPGAWTGSISLVFGGVFAVLSAPPQAEALYAAGWLSIASGILLAVWALKFQKEHWWRKVPAWIAQQIRKRATSPDIDEPWKQEIARLRSDFEPKIERFTRHIDKLEKEAARERAKSLTEYYRVRRLPLPQKMDDPKLAMSLECGVLTYEADMDFAMIGIPAEEVAGRIADAEKRVRSEASYYVIDDGEKEIWASGEEKREWHIRDAQIAALMKLAGEVDKWWTNRN